MRNSRFSLTLTFTALTFVILLISIAVAGLLIFGLAQFSFFPMNGVSNLDILLMLLFMYLISLIVGTLIAFVAVRIPLKPINQLITQMNRLAGGDFSARLELGRFGSVPAFAEVEKSFNKMAEELGNTDVLRSDFVNNISHEFKTPLVSIAGFGKLLQKGGLSREQQEDYINAIVEESRRLSHMATNVLSLSKVESQSILTSCSSFNLSEQIRSAVLLLENAWSTKRLDLDIVLPEVTISGNEAMLKEVWINLLDNAVKFSPEYGPLQIRLTQEPQSVTVTIANSGSLSPEEQARIWRKFYQVDRSHSGTGSGLGLAIVKRIVELHNGTAAVTSRDGAVIFTITLPRG